MTCKQNRDCDKTSYHAAHAHGKQMPQKASASRSSTEEYDPRDNDLLQKPEYAEPGTHVPAPARLMDHPFGQAEKFGVHLLQAEFQRV